MEKSQKTLTICILAYILILVVSIIFQIEHFPLTWAPMFSNTPTTKTAYSISVLDSKEVRTGIEVEYLDGSKGRINHKDLNIPYQLGSITDGYVGIYRLIVALCDKEIEVDFGIFPIINQLNRKKRARRVYKNILSSINRTLSNKTDDPKFIVNLSVKSNMISFSDLSTFPKAQPSNPRTLSCEHLIKRRNSL